MSRQVTLSITISALGHLYRDDLAALTDLARIADATGIDQLAIPDPGFDPTDKITALLESLVGPQAHPRGPARRNETARTRSSAS